ncbi:MAG: diguanylate cyclase, partial [Rubrivivax sp.]|nr:diguanylate cyclase [Rubrivivax sp.]
MNPPLTFSDANTAEQPDVLLVDDDEVNLLLTGLALRERGFRITEAASGEQALALLADWTPDIVVLDALMPGLDGFATCRQLRATSGFENVPVLMLTGLDDDASITRAYQAGATDFFVKATQWGLLAGRLHYLLRASRTRIELERSKAKLARAQDLARMGSFDWRRSEGGLMMSPEALRVFGRGPLERVSLRGLLRMVPQDDLRALLRLLHDVLQHSSVLATDVPITLYDGRQRIIHVEAEPEFNDQGQTIGYTGIVQDVTDRRIAEDKIRHLANFDTLTGLPNRRQLIWRAERALEHARRSQHQFAMLLIDLDRFKIINDTLGHQAGDQLLVQVAERLTKAVRDSDVVARLGGDEFVVVLTDIDTPVDAAHVADKIVRSIGLPYLIDAEELRTSPSIGICIFPDDAGEGQDLLKKADVAMYHAK